MGSRARAEPLERDMQATGGTVAVALRTEDGGPTRGEAWPLRLDPSRSVSAPQGEARRIAVVPPDSGADEPRESVRPAQVHRERSSATRPVHTPDGIVNESRRAVNPAASNTAVVLRTPPTRGGRAERHSDRSEAETNPPALRVADRRNKGSRLPTIGGVYRWGADAASLPPRPRMPSESVPLPDGRPKGR